MSDYNKQVGDTGIRVQTADTRPRTTQNNSVGFQLKSGLASAADGALGAAQVAAPFVPGGAVLSAAISGVGSVSSRIGSNSSSTTAGAPNSVGLVSGGGGGGAATSGVTGGGGNMPADLQNASPEAKANYKIMEMGQSFNMQYLMLQQKMQDESRRFTLISNIMKTKHDTAKNSISNVR